MSAEKIARNAQVADAQVILDARKCAEAIRTSLAGTAVAERRLRRAFFLSTVSQESFPKTFSSRQPDRVRLTKRYVRRIAELKHIRLAGTEVGS